MNKLLVLSILGAGAYVLMKDSNAAAAPTPVHPSAPAKQTPPAPAKKAPAPTDAPPPVAAHPNWNIEDSLLSGVPASLITSIDQAYAQHDPVALAAWIPSLTKLSRPDLAGIVQQDVQSMAASG